MFAFCNKTGSTVWVMFEWRFPNCSDGGDWKKKGWWQIAPQQTAVVYGADVAALHSCSYFYAESADGREWAGPIPEYVPQRAFDWCVNTSSTDARRVGMREVCTGNFNNYTVNLT
jgi:uncharacterized membrane protein